MEGQKLKLVFILSSGRTGTKALAHYFQAVYPEILSVHEPAPSYRLRIASTMYWAGRFPRRYYAMFLRQCRRRILARVNQTIYVESNPFLWSSVLALEEAFKSPRVLHITRDPRTYIQSGINWGVFRGIKNLANAYVPYWHARPAWRIWRHMSSTERLAWFWTVVNRRLNEAEEQLGDRYLRIAFEDVFQDGGGGLRQAVDFLGMRWRTTLADQLRTRINESTSHECQDWRAWDTSVQDRVLIHTGELMRMYGYLTP